MGSRLQTTTHYGLTITQEDKLNYYNAMSEKTGVRSQESEEQICMVCGCTPTDCSQCIERTGEPCFWVHKGFCSACLALIFGEVHDEIAEAFAQHRENNEGISFNTWLGILGEEYGEACHAILDAQTHKGWFSEDVYRRQALDTAREELVQVAATAIQMIREIDSGV